MGSGTLEDKTITLVCGADLTNITFVNFCTNKQEVAEFWHRELQCLIRDINPLRFSKSDHLHKIYRQIILNANSNQNVPVKAISKIFAQNKDGRRVVEKALDQSGLPSGKNDDIDVNKFTFQEFKTFYRNLTHRTEVDQVFRNQVKADPDKKVMSAQEFLSFLNNHQRDPRLNEILHPYAAEEKALGLIEKYEPNQHLVTRGQLSAEGFLWYLMSPDNLVMPNYKIEQNEAMEKPLSHYFINSSHNTYLIGHQITGRSSVEMYRQVLLSGCRCIELDFWNGKDEEPRVLHGYTFVPDIPAKEVIQAIAEYAFKTSDYPLILSFENHCNPKQQVSWGFVF